MNELKVSIIVPTYNRRREVFRAIDSALAQTAQVFEIIVVDDGSTDGTADAVEQQYGSRVRVFRQANAGVSAARNHGIRESRGEWVGFLDSDDWWHPEKLARQFEAIDSFKGTSGVCFTNNVYGGNPEMTFSRFEEVGFENASAIGLLDDTPLRIVTEREPFFTSSFLIRRVLLVEIGGFDEILVIREDTDLAFRLSFKTPFCFVGAPLTEIDRTPTRTLGLCNVYATRDDTVFICSERIFRKWLAMPEVIGTPYEETVRDLLQEVFYASAECKLHDMRLMPALRDVVNLKQMGYGLRSIVTKLLVRKMRKIKRKRASRFAPVGSESDEASIGSA
jgi:glycosyltransferase involved in cell wall biosynthesis